MEWNVDVIRLEIVLTLLPHAKALIRTTIVITAGLNFAFKIPQLYYIILNCAKGSWMYPIIKIVGVTNSF